MNSIADYLDRRFRQHSGKFSDIKDLGLLLWGKRNRFLGVVLGNEILTLDYRYFTSCRIRVSNMINLPYATHYYEVLETPFSIEYLQSYFLENHDNPYGVWNYMRSLTAEERPTELTQFPPLHYSKENVATSIERMQKLAQPADVIFTYDRNSGLSRLVRKSDRGMWSHVATVSDTGTLVESTTSGVVESDFSRLNDSELDVGLYRPKGITKNQQDGVVREMRKMVGLKGYNWYAVVRLYLQLQWRIPYRRKANQLTPADIMYGNRFELIDYA